VQFIRDTEENILTRVVNYNLLIDTKQISDNRKVIIMKKRILTMMLLFFFAFTMLPVGKVMADPAPPTGTLTMVKVDGNVRSESEYVAYQVATLDASVDSKGKPVYTNIKWDMDYRSVITTTLGIPSDSTDYAISNIISELSPENTDKLAIALKQATPSDTSPYTANKGEFKNLKYGYYLVIETANNANDGEVIFKPILVAIPRIDGVAWNSCVDATVKTSKARIEKKIVENNNRYDTNTAAVGDTVQYQSQSDIPTYSANAVDITYFVTDTFSTGLTYKSDINAKIVDKNGTQIKSLVAGSGNDYTLETTSASFKLTLNNIQDIKNWGDAGYKLLLTYSADLNSNATFGNTGNPNTIALTYTTNPKEGKTYTTSDTVITYTTKLEILKTDGGNNRPLAGVTFELSWDRNKGVGHADWVKIGEDQTTDVDGKAFFNTLEQGIYKLTEISAPSGYVRLDNPIIFTVSAKNGSLDIPHTNIIVENSSLQATWNGEDAGNKIIEAADGTLSVSIENTKGFTLPGTGGIGTTIFTVAGIAIILLGCSMIFVYFKRTRLSSAK
jgi:fimbrial isopeptide formation D2 family protein/LPXTG-motif cell wall-anchored protein